MGHTDVEGIDQEYPEPTVGGLVFNAQGQLLIVKSHKWKGKYTIPGGHVEVGERLEDALRREVKEETGLDVHDIAFLCFQEYIGGDSFWEKRHFIFFDFTCQSDEVEVVLNEEAQEYRWLDPREALQYPIDDYLRYSLHVYLDQQEREGRRGG
ncbi:MAG: NUDIX domain-containing protein [Anaerolineales bacterium]